jgi:hypothetical protein
MKNFILILFVTLGLGCRDYKADQLKTFIPGTYIRFSHHEMGREWDTLVLSLQNEGAGQFRIEKKWKYERQLDGQVLEPEYKKSVSAGIYDIKDQLLRDEGTGATFTFDSKRNQMFAGAIAYKKIN